MSNISINSRYLRQWQKDSFVGYLDRLDKQFEELTVAYQGSGKTLYTALCFVASVLKDSRIKDLSLAEIAIKFKQFEVKDRDFAIIFVPKNSIKESTLDDWEKLGVQAVCLKNEKLKTLSPQDLIEQGYNALVCSYQQACNGRSYKSEWITNTLVQFIKRSPDVNIHAILDECHTLTLTKLAGNTREPNKTAKYFIYNEHLFCKIHLVTGTPQKVGYGFVKDPEKYPKDMRTIPHVRYTLEGDAIPDTNYTQEDAIRDGVIVKTTPLLHSINNVKFFINGEFYALSKEDIEWYVAEANRTVKTDEERFCKIFECFNCIYGSTEIWTQLLVYGDHWLKDTREVYPRAKGIIFAPSRKSAIKVHKELLNTRSVLCLGTKKNEYGIVDISSECNFVYSKDIGKWLKENENTIDWIVSCEALNLGFNYPDLKVSILIPRLEFLSMAKLSQTVQRINRTIEGYPNLSATCVTLDYEPIVELIKLSQDSKFGLYNSPIYTSEILDLHTYRTIEALKRKIEAVEQGEIYQVNTVKIVNFALDAFTKKLTPDGEVLYCYKPEVKHLLTESTIRTYWTLWSDIVHSRNDLDIQKLPPRDSGVYIIINAKTSEYFYVGSSDNLYTRVSPGSRYLKDLNKFMKEEGVENLNLDLYISWIVTDNYLDQEDLCKDQLKPKYDKEKRRLKSYPKEILIS